MNRTEVLMSLVYCAIICAFETGCAPVIPEATPWTSILDVYNAASSTVTSGRSKRYTLDGSKWCSESLTYRISKYPSRLDEAVVDGEILRAFALWSNHTGLSFSPGGGKVDIKIRFESGRHGDGVPFDGRGGKMLAHSNYPGPGCQVHFDDDEDWTIGGREGTNLFQVAVHELGHSLGLDRSPVEGSVVNPHSSVFHPNFSLGGDDLDGIQVGLFLLVDILEQAHQDT